MGRAGQGGARQQTPATSNRYYPGSVGQLVPDSGTLAAPRLVLTFEEFSTAKVASRIRHRDKHLGETGHDVRCPVVQEPFTPRPMAQVSTRRLEKLRNGGFETEQAGRTSRLGTGSARGHGLRV